MVQPLWKTVWRFLKTLKLELPYDPAITLLGIYPEKNKNSNSKRCMHPSVHSSTILFCFLNFFEFYLFLYSRFLLVIYFIYISVYMSIPISQFIPPPPPRPPAFPPWCPYICSLQLSLFLSCKLVHLYHFSRFHIYVLIDGIFLFLTYFTLYDTL